MKEKPAKDRRPQCVRCKQKFDQREDWQTLCYGCWRLTKAEESYERGFQDGKAVSVNTSGGLHYAKGYAAGRQNGYSEGWQQAFLEMRMGGPFDLAFVNELIALCHPDRHAGRTEKANAVTARLLEFRRGMKQERNHDHR
jgi:hypothetical protein